MSGVYIPGMEMPKSCDRCFVKFCEGRAKEERISIQRHESCPLVPVSPHGRLGDLDRLEINLRNMAKYQSGYRQQGIFGCCETIRLTPTIIPASEDGDDEK